MDLNIVSQDVPLEKKTAEPKLLILVAFFSGEDTSSTDTSIYIHVLLGNMLFHFYFDHLVYWVRDMDTAGRVWKEAADIQDQVYEEAASHPLQGAKNKRSYHMRNIVQTLVGTQEPLLSTTKRQKTSWVWSSDTT